MRRSPPAIIAALILQSAMCLAQQPPEDGLLFHLSFDRRDVVAEYAGGNPRSTTFTESLELRGVEGIHEYGSVSKSQDWVRFCSGCRASPPPAPLSLNDADASSAGRGGSNGNSVLRRELLAILNL